MLFALNYSPQAAALLDTGQIQLDLYKCPDWTDLIAQAKRQRPPYIHFPLLAGKMGSPDWDFFTRLRDETQTPFINIHLGVHTTIPLDSCRPDHTRRFIDDMLRDIEPVVRRYGAENVILENLLLDKRYLVPRIALEPQIIRDIVEQTGCGFLLDLAHATSAARSLGWDERHYIACLPVDRLREMHITGLQRQPDGLWLDHYPMYPADWEMVEWAFSQIRAGQWSQPRIVALEYGGIGPIFNWRSRSEVIARDVPRLYDLVHRA
jgi:uncharacterized protein